MTSTATHNHNVKGSNKKKSTKSFDASSSPVLSVQERMDEVYKGKEMRKIHTYDKGTGYFITSVFPMLSQAECNEQAVSITEEIIALIENS